MKKFLLVFSIFLMGCGSLHEKYVEQDHNNYETLWPYIEKMLKTTTELNENQKGDVIDRGASWDLWTTEALKILEVE